ncbi:MAG: XcyI family restriction endonuclease [Richelia sp. SM1_7_0]|nr:XcyI family restriction endonuclease [Richelia sp. SM1_7_0]
MTIDKEANRINYRLRSTFFYRKLKEYNTLSFSAKIDALLPVKQLYIWDDRANWGIGEDAFTYVSNHSNLELIQVFCHPKLIREHSILLAYYRNIAALSQKAVNYLVGINLKKLETDEQNQFPLAEDKAFVLSRLFNEHISLIIDSSIESLTEKELYGILLASTGTQIDGSWRNAIGEEAEKLYSDSLLKKQKSSNFLPLLSHVQVQLLNYTIQII